MLTLLLCVVAAPALQARQATPAPSTADASPARALVHMLDYLAQDYPAAVADGAVINAFEYEEMQQFGNSVSSMIRDLQEAGVITPDSAFQESSGELMAGIEAKGAPADIAALANAIRDRVIEEADLQVAPLQWPDVERGRALYADNCVACHGEGGAGDGPLAPGLEPQPTSFTEGERIASSSPFQAYNTIRLGVEGTAMQAASHLTDQQVWDLAFYVKSIQSALEHPAAGEAEALPSYREAATLQQVATLGDAELAAVLAAHGVDRPAEARAALRLAGPAEAAGGTLVIARRYLEEANTLYRGGRPAEARQQAILAYLEGVEPIEPQLRATDAVLTTMLEQRMLNVRSAIEQDEGKDQVGRSVELALGSVDQARGVLQERESSPWFAFLLAASILLREGLEAFLIVLAILGVVRAVGRKDAALWVHGGWIVAVLIGVAAWFFSDLLLRLGATERELMEAGISLVAVVVLLYVGFWLHSKTEIRKWREFIDVRVKNMLQGGNLFGLAVIAFFAVFREAFESVLFLSALTLEEGGKSKMAIAAGAVLAIVAVLILAAILLRYSARLPIKTMFRYSSFVMGVLSVILVGKGIHAVQETGLMSISTAPFTAQFGLLGVYPTVETLVAQVVVLLLVLALWNLPKWLPLLRREQMQASR